jgi:hypothetical protein
MPQARCRRVTACGQCTPAYITLPDPVHVVLAPTGQGCILYRCALIFLCLDFASLSLFSQVGLITRVGLISKHGILMVDFARRLQERGVAFEDTLIEAAAGGSGAGTGE